MSEHTKEPWKVGYGPDQCITVIGGRSDVAWVLNPAAGLNDTARSYAEDEANARRIVACVNACQGLDTADLEATGLVSAVGYQLIELTKQRDILVAENERFKASQMQLNSTEKIIVEKNQLSIWTVYERPLDHPEKFVARRWVATLKPSPTDDVLFADDLDSLRKMLPPGLMRMPRQHGDDPVILETWI